MSVTDLAFSINGLADVPRASPSSPHGRALPGKRARRPAPRGVRLKVPTGLTAVRCPMPHRLVKDVIKEQKPFVAPGKTTVLDAVRLMKKHAVGAIMVVDAGKLSGIFTERDAVFRVLAEARDPAGTRIADVMTAKPQTIAPDKMVGYALLLMYEGGFRHVPVVERGRPVGMISARDALGPEVEDFQAELLHREHLREIIA